MRLSFDEEYTCLNCPRHIPKEAYFYIPNESEQYIVHPEDNERIQRFIFWKPSLSHYTEKEQILYKKFSDFYNEIGYKEVDIRTDFTVEEMMKIVQGGKGDNQKALEKLKNYINHKNLQITNDKYNEILYSGVLYMHGFSNNYSPILVLKTSFFKEYFDKYTAEDFIFALDKFFAYLIKHFFIPGQIERVYMLIDLEKVNLSKPLVLKEVFSYLQLRHLNRLAKMYFMNVNPVLQILFKGLAGFIEAGTQKKFKFLKKDEAAQIFEDINQSQVEEKYGGTASNVTDFSYPFIVPGGDVTQGEARGRFIDEQEYLDMCVNNLISVPCPYIDTTNFYDPQEIEKNKYFIRKIESNNLADTGLFIEGHEEIPNRCQCKCSIF